MNQKTIIALFLWVLSTTLIFAQDKKSNPQAEEEANKNISTVIKINEKVNTEITNSSYFNHQITLNSLSKAWMGVAKYNENLTYYFELNNGIAKLRKIIISSNIADRTGYTDILFDENGNLALYYINPNLLDPNSKKERFYYLDKKPVGIAKDSDSYNALTFTNEQVQETIDIRLKVEKYQKIFDNLIAVQYSR